VAALLTPSVAPVPKSAEDDAMLPPVIIAVGPEGGIEPDELERFTEAGFHTASIGSTILRFETAAIAALGIVRSLTAEPSRSAGGGPGQGADSLSTQRSNS
jgi:16S rRNA (uracil1498-N3)-methyltransferase